MPDRRVQLSREAKKTRFQDNPVSSTVAIPPRRQPRCDTSTRNRRKFKLDVTDPDLLIPLKQTWVTTRHSSDLREPQPSPSDSHPASLQPVSETTTSESSVSLPSVKELAKFFTPSSDEEDHSCVNTRTRYKKLFEPKEGGKE